VLTNPLGWSFGGVVAFEVARQLLRQGTDARVVLIDSPSPTNHVQLPESLLDYVIDLNERDTRSTICQFIKAQFQLNSRVLAEYNPLPNDGPFPSLLLLRSCEDFQAPGISDIPAWLQNRSDARQATCGWESLTGSSVTVRDIPGHHFQPFNPSHACFTHFLQALYSYTSRIEEVSRQISEGCKYLEGLSCAKY
jgi:thioesterase domain-containing protein